MHPDLVDHHEKMVIGSKFGLSGEINTSGGVLFVIQNAAWFLELSVSLLAAAYRESIWLPPSATTWQITHSLHNELGYGFFSSSLPSSPNPCNHWEP